MNLAQWNGVPEMKEITVTRRLPVKYTVDLCVVGAGPAGMAAVGGKTSREVDPAELRKELRKAGAFFH